MGILTAIIISTLAGGLLTALIPSGKERALRISAFSASGLAVLLSAAALLMYSRQNAGLQFEEQYRWLETGGMVHFAADGLGLLVMLFANLVCLLAALLPFNCAGRRKEYYFWLLMAQASFSGLTAAHGLLTFSGFWLLSIVPLYFLAAIWGGREKERAAFKFLVHQLSWGAVTVAAAVALEHASPAAPHLKTWAAALLTASIAARVPLIPLHLWARELFAQSPGQLAALFAGPSAACALYALIKTVIPACGPGFAAIAPAAAGIAAVGAMLAALLALAQKNIKISAAYFAMTSGGMTLAAAASLNVTGLTGAGMALLAFPAAAAALLFAAEIYNARFETTSADSVHGLIEVMPGFGLALGIGLGGMAAVPLSGGFIAIFLLIAGTTKPAPWCAVPLGLAALCVSAAAIRIFSGTVWGKYNRADTPAPLGAAETFSLVTLAALIITLGVYPAPALNFVESAVTLALAALKNI